MVTKGCWTCKDRKVACDRATPKCLKCMKSKRECGGYGVRLTWPQQVHNRAFVAHTPADHVSLLQSGGAYQWVNVVPTDICLHLATSASLGDEGKRLPRNQLAFPRIPEKIQTNLGYAATNDLELLHYFESVVVNLLPMIYTDRLRLCKLILQVALSDQGKASRAVYHAILAISSYHQGGDLLYVDQLKRTALNELRTDVVSSEREGVQHIAANLLLCVLEQTSGNNSGWVGYISGVKQVIDAVKEAEPPVGSDASLVLGWVYYFEVMARFVFRHWRTEYVKAVAKALGFDANGSDSCRLQYILARASFTRSIPNISMHAHPIMVLLAEIAETAMYSSDPRYTTPEYQRYLNDLRSRLEQVSPLTHTVDGSMHNEVDHHTTLLLDLTRLAGLIYLERVSRNFSGQSARIDSWTRQALSTLTELDSCLCPFALSIVGCETVRDADRLIILGLYSRMEARPHLQSFMDIKSLLHTAWNLQDLAEEGELEYIQKLNIVFSSRDVVPSLI